MISTKWWKSLESCRSFNTVDIGSDHKMETAKFNLSLRATKQSPNNRCKFNSDKLLDPQVSDLFDLTLKNRFTSLLDEAKLSTCNQVEQIQMRSDALDAALIETRNSVIEKRKKQHQPQWVSKYTLQLINSQTDAKNLYKRQPTHANKLQWHEL